MFERFTVRARRVVVLAQEEARALGHNYIGTEHMLLGLLREEEGVAARALESLGMTVDEVRDQVARIIGRGDEPTAGAGQIPFTPRAKKVLELSLREARSLGHDSIGTEAILLGIVRENDGVAAQIMLGFGADPDRVRDTVGGMLHRPGDPGTTSLFHRPRPIPRRPAPSAPPVAGRTGLLVAGWLLFAVALAIGLLLGWLIWA